MGKRQLVAAVLGVVVSAYSVYVEGRKREDEDFQPVCNINSWSSCTSAFEHPVGTGFGFICDITGEGMYFTQWVINWGASFRWSFGPLSAWGSIESTTILTTHPSLVLVE